MSDNEKPQSFGDRGNRQLSGSSRSQVTSSVKSGENETRRNAAACFHNSHKTEDWHADYTGLTVVEGIRNGDKVWINVYVRTSRKGDKYLSVVLKAQKGK